MITPLQRGAACLDAEKIIDRLLQPLRYQRVTWEEFQAEKIMLRARGHVRYERLLAERQFRPSDSTVYEYFDALDGARQSGQADQSTSASSENPSITGG